MTAPRLSDAALNRAMGRRPAFDRTRLSPGIVHIGLGAFFRAHVASYTDDAIETDPDGHSSWGTIGVSLRSPSVRDRLQPQSCLYTAIERGPSGDRARILGSLVDAMVAPEDPGALVALLARPQTRLVTVTVTEKGYCHHPATGRLDPAHPDIVADLASPVAPVSLVGFLVAALAKRRVAGIAPFAVMSCDNLPSNGLLLARLVRDFAALRDDGLAAWIEATIAFPCTMVDRIVPASTSADEAAALALTGLVDRAPVVHEPFRQWVIEDVLPASARPAWERAGAQFAGDVAPFELMKLRMLNGTHSTLAWLGGLAGHDTIAEAVADPALRAFVQGLWRDEISPTVPAPPGSDLAAYAGELLRRYDNPGIRHRTAQIATDSSQKLPQRLLGPIRHRLAAGAPWPRLALAVAGFIRHCGGIDLAGRPTKVRDPLAGRLRDKSDGTSDPAARVGEVLSIDSIFGDLSGDPHFVRGVVAAYERLVTMGVREAVRATERPAAD